MEKYGVLPICPLENTVCCQTHPLPLLLMREALMVVNKELKCRGFTDSEFREKCVYVYQKAKTIWSLHLGDSNQWFFQYGVRGLVFSYCVRFLPGFPYVASYALALCLSCYHVHLRKGRNKWYIEKEDISNEAIHKMSRNMASEMWNAFDSSHSIDSSPVVKI